MGIARPLQEGQQHRRWEVKESKDGSGAELRPHIFVTASEPGLTNGLVVTTTRRIYYITCKSVPKAPTRVLRWHYDSLARRPERARGRTREPPLLPLPDQPMHYHVGYEMQVSQPAPSWVPRFIVDDGKKTYLIYPEVTLFESVPLLRLLGPNGPQLVNSLQYLNVVIVDQLVARAELRMGTGERAQVVTITRGKLRTIQCPGDAACPVWPAAAAVLAGRLLMTQGTYVHTPYSPQVARLRSWRTALVFLLLMALVVGGGIWVLRTYGKRVKAKPVEPTAQHSPPEAKLGL